MVYIYALFYIWKSINNTPLSPEGKSGCHERNKSHQKCTLFLLPVNGEGGFLSYVLNETSKLWTTLSRYSVGHVKQRTNKTVLLRERKRYTASTPSAVLSWRGGVILHRGRRGGGCIPSLAGGYPIMAYLSS